MRSKPSFQQLLLVWLNFLWLPSLLIYIAAKNLLLDLILALQNEPAARILQSRIADRTLSGGLTILYSRVDSSQWSVVSAVPLVEQVLSSEPDLATWSDAEFWSAVFGLVS